MVDLIEMRKTDSFGETRLIRTYLAHQELKSEFVTIMIIET